MDRQQQVISSDVVYRRRRNPRSKQKVASKGSTWGRPMKQRSRLSCEMRASLKQTFITILARCRVWTFDHGIILKTTGGFKYQLPA